MMRITGSLPVRTSIERLVVLCLREINFKSRPPPHCILLKRKLAPRLEVTCPKSESSVVTKPGLELRSADSQPSALSAAPAHMMVVVVCETPAPQTVIIH